MGDEEDIGIDLFEVRLAHLVTEPMQLALPLPTLLACKRTCLFIAPLTLPVPVLSTHVRRHLTVESIALVTNLYPETTPVVIKLDHNRSGLWV